MREERNEVFAHPLAFGSGITLIPSTNVIIVSPMAQLFPSDLLCRIKREWIGHGGVEFGFAYVSSIGHPLQSVEKEGASKRHFRTLTYLRNVSNWASAVIRCDRPRNVRTWCSAAVHDVAGPKPWKLGCSLPLRSRRQNPGCSTLSDMTAGAKIRTEQAAYSSLIRVEYYHQSLALPRFPSSVFQARQVRRRADMAAIARCRCAPFRHSTRS